MDRICCVSRYLCQYEFLKTNVSGSWIFPSFKMTIYGISLNLKTFILDEQIIKAACNEQDKTLCTCKLSNNKGIKR